MPSRYNNHFNDWSSLLDHTYDNYINDISTNNSVYVNNVTTNDGVTHPIRNVTVNNNSAYYTPIPIRYVSIDSGAHRIFEERPMEPPIDFDYSSITIHWDSVPIQTAKKKKHKLEIE